MTCLLCRQSFLAKALLSLVNEQAFWGLGREKRREGLNGGDDDEQEKEGVLFALEVFDYCVLLIDQLASSCNHLVLPGRFGDVHCIEKTGSVDGVPSTALSTPTF